MLKNYKPGMIVRGRICGIQPYGAFVSLDDCSGLIHISEISDKYVKNIEDFVYVGEDLFLKVLDIDEEHDHLKLSLKALSYSPRQSRRNSYDFMQRKKVLNKEQTNFPIIEKQISDLLSKENEKMIKVNLSNAFINEDITSYQTRVSEIHNMIHNKTGRGNDFLGWVDWPDKLPEKEVLRIQETGKYIHDNFDVLVVCGIGGSYLGARAGIDYIEGLYPNSKLEIVYMGNTFSSTYVNQVLEYLKDKNFAVNVISKSGTTTETAIGFRQLQQLLIEKYGKENIKDRIYATTDKARGALKTLADKEGYQTFVIEDDIGGRYSVLTPVGLLPFAAKGIDIYDMMLGAKGAYYDLKNDNLNENEAYKYAVARYILGKKYKAEMFVTYEPHLTMLAEWWKQLFGESEGKEHKGLLPVSATFSTDLHSLGQFIQDGTPVLFETVFKFNKPLLDATVPFDEDNLDKLNYLAGKKMSEVNYLASEGTLKAHVETGNVPNILVDVKEDSAKSFGYVAYFFMKACGMSAYLLDINPFDQPGVEVYKKNMFHLLGKPGF